MSKDQDQPSMSEADLNLAQGAMGMDWQLPDDPLTADDLRRMAGWPHIPTMPTRPLAGGRAATEDLEDLREHRSNAMYYAALLHGEAESQEVFRDDEIEKAVTAARRIFRYIWEGE
jgi:hypothetical protein